MEVYKVVQKNRIYPLQKGTFMSSRTWLDIEPSKIDQAKAVLFYSINKVTKPNFGLIFCFKDLKNAKKFQKEYGGYILHGKGIPAGKKTPIYFGSCEDSHESLEKGWKNTIIPIEVERKFLPIGTLFMRTFKPLEVIKG